MSQWLFIACGVSMALVACSGQGDPTLASTDSTTTSDSTDQSDPSADPTDPTSVEDAIAESKTCSDTAPCPRGFSCDSTTYKCVNNTSAKGKCTEANVETDCKAKFVCNEAANKGAGRCETPEKADGGAGGNKNAKGAKGHTKGKP
jgi:hypothetical protein